MMVKKEGMDMDSGSLSLRILLCDDDPVFLERLRQELRGILKARKLGGAIHTFERPGDIPPELLASCGIFFLDMDFTPQNETGLALAKGIRQVNPEAVIIFLTNYIEYAPAGYEVQAFRYLLKSDAPSKLERSLLDAITHISARREAVTFSVSGEPVTFCLEDILYLEAQGHTVAVHTRQQKEYRLYASLAGLEQQLGSRGFLRIQKSYLVNMRRIQRFRCDSVTLDSGTTLPVSEKSYREQKNRYLLWKGLG